MGKAIEAVILVLSISQEIAIHSRVKKITGLEYFCFDPLLAMLPSNART